MDRRIIATTVVIVAATAALAGCAQAGVPALERAATNEDMLPAEFTDTPGFDHETARHVASAEGVEFFLARQGGDASAQSVCLIVYPTETPANWASGCGEGDRIGVSTATGVMAEFVRHGVSNDDVKPGWTRVAENVIVSG